MAGAGAHRHTLALHGRGPERHGAPGIRRRPPALSARPVLHHVRDAARGPSASTPGFSTAEESNAFYRRNLAAGQKGLSVAFDLATHRGYDSDNERVVGDVGKAGVAIDSVEDMKILFDQIPLGQMSVSMTMNGAVLPIMAFYIVAAEEQGVAPGAAQRNHSERHSERVHGAQHLYLSAAALHAHHRRHLPLLRRQNMPKFNCISHQRLSHAGSRRDRRYRAGLHAGRWPRIHPHGHRRRPGYRRFRAAPQLLLGHRHEPLHGDRQAARGARAVGQTHPGLPPEESRSPWRCARTARPPAGASTAQDVFNNVPRTVVEALAAVLGHTQSLHTNALDEAIALPTDFSARIARNTQIYLQEETGITQVVDPWARQLLRGEPHPRADAPGVAAHSGNREPGRHGQGHRDRPSQDAHRRSRRAPAGAHRFRQGTIVGVNKYQPDSEAAHRCAGGG